MSSVANLSVAQRQALELRIREQELTNYAFREQRESTRTLLASIEREVEETGY